MKRGVVLAAAAFALLAGALLLRRSTSAPPEPPPPGNTVPGDGPSGATAPARPEDAPRPAPQPSGPPASPRELLRRAGAIVAAYFHGDRSALPPGVAAPHEYATNLPAGYFQLLVRAFPDEAFEIYSTDYLGNPEKAVVAYWALGELARLRHAPTFQLFNAQLDGGDPVRARQALKALAHYEAPQLGPRILARVPADPADADEAELLRTALRTAASIRGTDPAALDALLDRFDRRAAELEIPDYYGTAESRRRARILRAPDPAAALADAVRLDGDDRIDDLERARWAADVAVRQGLRSLAPALRERVDREIGKLRSEQRLGELDVLARHGKGLHDVPSAGALGGLEEVRAIAHLRRAILDLGGELTDEERRWLDGLRMLRTPREYLVEAGLLGR